jgi:PAS domain S-box-containing protein
MDQDFCPLAGFWTPPKIERLIGSCGILCVNVAKVSGMAKQKRERPRVTPDGASTGARATGGAGGTLQLGEAIYHKLFDEVPAAISVCDAQGHIQLYNEAARKLWGRTPIDGVDLWYGAQRIYRPDGTPLGMDESPIAVATKLGAAVGDVEMIVERPDQSRRNVLAYANCLGDAAGRTIGAVGLMVDLTDRYQEIATAKSADLAQARLGAIVECSDDAIISKTLDGIITSWNRAAQRLFGYTAAEAVGKSILLIVPPDRHDEEATILNRLRHGERIEHFETQRKSKDGRLLDISLTVSPVRDSSGTIIGASKIGRDITDKKRLERQRDMLLKDERYAREEAQRVNRMKDEFLATLSHELRTPLNAIMGWAQLLTVGGMSGDELREGLAVIERNARAQKQLIDDLLDMSRIISGKLRLDVQRVDPITFIEAAIQTVLPSADAKQIRVDIMLDPRAGPISGDPGRLQQVVWNLLSNAVKFTPKGGRVRVTLESVNSHVELTIADTGEGIAPRFLSQLFARFSQADASTNRKHGGLGLGLAITRQLVELHGGRILAKSAGQGKGSTFTVQLPLLVLTANNHVEERVQPRSSVGTTIRKDQVNLSGVKVLLVEDEPDARELVKRLLSESGAEVAVANSASEALDWLQKHNADVLISDIGMPDIDGYEFLRRVRKLRKKAPKQTPAIALTAFARSEDRTRALRAGYIAHVAKPVEPSELLATVAVIAGRVE